jgi:hypothetical protein
MINKKTILYLLLLATIIPSLYANNKHNRRTGIIEKARKTLKYYKKVALYIGGDIINISLSTMIGTLYLEKYNYTKEVPTGPFATLIILGFAIKEYLIYKCILNQEDIDNELCKSGKEILIEEIIQLASPLMFSHFIFPYLIKKFCIIIQ